MGNQESNFEKEEIIVSSHRKTIPKPTRRAVWDKYIGVDKGQGQCDICKRTIDKLDFECGHIIADADGGSITVDNLIPICGDCNKSMGKENYYLFKAKYMPQNMTRDDHKLAKKFAKLDLKESKPGSKQSSPISNNNNSPKRNSSPNSKQCTKIKKNGERCKRMTTRENGECGIHKD
jgi:hypothetical protein